MRQFLNCFGVLKSQLFSRTHFLAHAAESERLQMENENDIRADASHQIADIIIKSASDRGHSDHDGNADHDPQHGQCRAQFVAADRVGRHLDNFAEFGSADHYISNLSATIGSSFAAFRAGYTPKNTPTLAATLSPAKTAQSLIDEGIPIRAVTTFAMVIPPKTPHAPPRR